MDEALPNQSEPKEKQAAGFQFHLSTLLALVLVAAMMIFANVLSILHPLESVEIHTFQGVEVHVYGWPLPMLYVDANREQPKLNPSIQCNYVSLYYDITVFVLVLVCAGAFFERRAKRYEQAAAGENTAPAGH